MDLTLLVAPPVIPHLRLTYLQFQGQACSPLASFMLLKFPCFCVLPGRPFLADRNMGSILRSIRSSDATFLPFLFDPIPPLHKRGESFLTPLSRSFFARACPVLISSDALVCFFSSVVTLCGFRPDILQEPVPFPPMNFFPARTRHPGSPRSDGVTLFFFKPLQPPRFPFSRIPFENEESLSFYRFALPNIGTFGGALSGPFLLIPFRCRPVFLPPKVALSQYVMAHPCDPLAPYSRKTKALP